MPPRNRRVHTAPDRPLADHDPDFDRPQEAIKPRELECAYPAQPEAVGWIRDTVTRAAHGWGAPLDTCARIRLVVSELATNARAASDPDGMIRVRLQVWPLVIRVGVWDASSDEPKINDGDLSLDEIDALPEDHDFGGWGLVLVRELASGHHVEKTESFGKYVCADFDIPEGHILTPERPVEVSRETGQGSELGRS